MENVNPIIKETLKYIVGGFLVATFIATYLHVVEPTPQRNARLFTDCAQKFKGTPLLDKNNDYAGCTVEMPRQPH